MVPGQVEVVQDPHPGYLRQDLAREVVAAEVDEGEKAAPDDLRHDPAGEVVPVEVDLGELQQPADLCRIWSEKLFLLRSRFWTPANLLMDGGRSPERQLLERLSMPKLVNNSVWEKSPERRCQAAVARCSG